MKEKQITVTQDELEKIVYEELQKERSMFFALCAENYFLLPIVKEKSHKGKYEVITSKEEWGKHLERLAQTFGDLELARETIKIMSPIYQEYREVYEKEHSFSFDDYIRIVNTAYDFEEFERVRDRFEEENYLQIEGANKTLEEEAR